MTRCVCSCEMHDDICEHNCHLPEEDDGTPTHSSCLTVDHKNPNNRYEGIYKTKDGYRA